MSKFLCEDSFFIAGDLVLVGRVLSGVLSPGQTLFMNGNSRRIKSVEFIEGTKNGVWQSSMALRLSKIQAVDDAFRAALKSTGGVVLNANNKSQID